MPGAKETVAFVGLGNMGWPMARNLAEAGYELVAFDADRERRERFAAGVGGVAADDAAGIAAASLVVTMLPDDAVVASALLDGGLAAALPPGALIVDMSSSNPAGTKATAAALPDGVDLVDAPVSGGVPRAEAGSLSIMLGGADDLTRRAMPVLEVLGDRIFRTGPLGSGHAMKALNNYLAAAAYTATAEALVIGREFDLDPETMIEVVNSSTGRSFSSEVVFAGEVVPGRYASGFMLGLLAKDVGIAADLARQAEVDAPACELVNRRWAEALRAQGFQQDHSVAHKTWSETDLRAAAPAAAGDDADG